MPYKKRRTYKKRTYRRRYRKRIPRRYPKNNLVSVKQKVNLWTTATEANIYKTLRFQALSFTASDIPQWTQFAELFDSYRLNAIKLDFSFDKDTSDVGADNPIPILHYAIDYNTAPTYTSQNSIQAYANARQRRMDKPFSVYFKPRFSLLANSTSGNGYVQGNPKTWLDASSSLIPFYGFTCCINANGNVPNAATFLGVVRLVATYYMQFKSVR